MALTFIAEAEADAAALEKEYGPDALKKKGEDFAVAEVTAGADRLIATSPTAQAMKDNFDHISQYELKGLPPLSLSEIKDLVIAEAEELGVEILDNTLQDLGIKNLPLAEIRALANMDFDGLVEAGIKYGKEQLADVAMEAGA